MSTKLQDDVLEDVGQGFGSIVVIYNDEEHTFDEVITQINKATSKPTSECENIAKEVDSKGKAVAYDGELPDCMRVKGILEEIALKVDIEIGD